MFLTLRSSISFFYRALRLRAKFLILLILVIVCYCSGFTFSNSFQPGGKVREVNTKFNNPASVNEAIIQLGHQNSDAHYTANEVNGSFEVNGSPASDGDLKESQGDESHVMNSVLSGNEKVDSNGTEGAVAEGSRPRGEDSDPIARDRRNKVREMTLHAWNSYKLYAWGKNELCPLARMGNDGGVFGSGELGATIVDSLDTLYIMGLKEQYEEGRDWVTHKFSFNNLSAELSVFETNIRFVGAFLTMYALTGDKMYKDKAKEVADRLLPAFETRTGIPNTLVNIRTGHSRLYDWSSSSILSEFGTLHLEFAYLSDITGNQIYRERVMNIRKLLKEMRPLNGLYPNYLDPVSGRWGLEHISLGGLGDSFYEYLLKSWLQSGRTDADARQMYDDAMEAIVNNLIQTSAGGLVYVAEMKYKQLEHKMDHLACFAGGLFALGAVTNNNSNSNRYMEMGKNITNTCHESYIRSVTHLGPEVFRFSGAIEAKTMRSAEKHYILRPETVESYFVLWRLTHAQKYRDWAWDAAQAIERYCRTDSGYSGIRNVYSEHPIKDDVQQSFYIAEVLKYLYLIYSDDSLLPLDQWVFNTEAHPLPIIGNPMYRPFQ